MIKTAFKNDIRHVVIELCHIPILVNQLVEQDVVMCHQESYLLGTKVLIVLCQSESVADLSRYSI